jgi:hypothetical protein
MSRLMSGPSATETVRGESVLKRTTRITVETRRVVVLSDGGGSTLQRCPTCDHEVRMLTPEHASAFANVRTRLVYQWVERGMVHFSETQDGSLLICVNSLPRLS